MSTWIWALVLIAAVWAAHWGAEHLSHPLKKLRRQWGFSVAAGGSFIGLAAASPEIGIAVTSAVRGVGDISLGASLGSNVLAIPAMVTVAYLATRTKQVEGKSEREHARHRREHLLRVGRGAVRVQALPYLGVLAVFTALTVPAPWRGLQPVDGWILLGLYVIYLVQALLRGRAEGERVVWKKKEIWKAVGGVAALALGAYFTVRATENIVSAVGLSRTVGGLFITAPMAALPEIFATWSVVRSGQVTSAVTSVIGDHVVTMTLAFFPLALVTLPVEDMQLFGVTLAFVVFVGMLYAAFIHWGASEHGFKRWQVLSLIGVYLAYVALMLFWVLHVFGGSLRPGSPSGETPDGTTRQAAGVFHHVMHRTSGRRRLISPRCLPVSIGRLLTARDAPRRIRRQYLPHFRYTTYRDQVRKCLGDEKPLFAEDPIVKRDDATLALPSSPLTRGVDGTRDEAH